MTSVKIPPTPPLMDRNPPNSVKSSLVHQSSDKFAQSPPTNSLTSPLKVSKRESQRTPLPAIPRRTSSSYKHLRNNNLVSKSPFKSHIPTPATPSVPLPTASPMRKVSSEKRPRPDSMYEQAENERPLQLKRERKQSQAFQGLLQKEPVTKSPFKYVLQEPALVIAPTRRLPVPSFTPTRLPTPATSSNRNSASPSPQRSSLVSKRLMGPRLSGGRRERRKTVTWDERCDVIEIDRHSEMSVDVFASDSEQEGSDGSMDLEGEEEENLFFQSAPQPQFADDSYESESELHLDPNASITGMVDSMLSANGVNRHETPPPKGDDSFAPDTEMEGGVPLGRSHHKDRLQEFHEQQPAHFEFSPQALSTPPKSSRPSTPATPPLNISRTSTSTPPLGRSTHIERVLAAKRDQEEEEEDVDLMPPSPSPTKTKAPSQLGERELFPTLDLGRGSETLDSGFNDNFFLPEHDDEIPEAEASFLSMSDNGRKNSMLAPEKTVNEEAPSDISCSFHSVDLALEPSKDSRPSPRLPIQERLAEKTPPVSAVDALAKRASMPVVSISPRRAPLPAIPSHIAAPLPGRVSPHNPGSPLSRPSTASPIIHSGASSPSLRPRISREDIRKRLMRQRSVDDVFDQPSSGPDTPATKQEEDRSFAGYDMRENISMCTDASELAIATIERVEYVNTGAVEATASPPMLPSALPSLETVTANEPSPVAERAPTPPQETFNGLTVEFGGHFGLKGLGIAGLDSRSTRGSFDSNTVKMGNVDVDMEMRSALDRLMDDVASTSAIADDDEGEYQQDWRPSNEVSSAFKTSPVSRNPSAMSNAPLAPPKNSIQQRQELILAKRREAREPESNGRHLKVSGGRPSKRRSMSTGDAEDMRRTQSADGVLDVPVSDTLDELHDSIDRELNKFKNPAKPAKYQVREREEIVYASSDADRVSHIDRVGDVNSSKAWRPVRRPSDMNEYSKQIKEYRSMDKGKAYGKVFIRVVGVRNLDVPLPSQPTAMSVTLNNGIHYVTTPECQLARDAPVEQEFELIEHSKLEFTLTVKVRRDPHIIAQFKSQVPGPASAPPTALPITQPAQSSSSKSGVRGFFSSSPKKSKEKAILAPPVPPPVQPRQQLHENLSRYMRPDGTLARAFVSFKDIAHRCDTRLFETSFPLIGQRLELGNKTSSMQVGELILQAFRLPPLPGIPQDELPQSLDECHRGLRHVNWHKVTYFEGVLTQNGGDCSSWRRRQFRIVGGNLIAFNDVTKRATATIDLKKALAVEDDQACNSALSPSSARSSRSARHADEYDGLYGVERSFRLAFPDDEDIVFFADTDEEKARWLDVLHALVGHIPPNPLWAELLWQRQDEANKRHTASKAARPSPHAHTKSYPR